MTVKPQKHIVVIDDEASVLETFAFFLSQSFEVSVFSDGADFLKIAHEMTVDLVISDFMMESMDGISLAKQLRALPQYESVPIILITALGNSEYMNAMAAGITDYITKPFDIQDVLASINRYLSAEAADTAKSCVIFPLQSSM